MQDIFTTALKTQTLSLRIYFFSSFFFYQCFKFSFKVKIISVFLNVFISSFSTFSFSSYPFIFFFSLPLSFSHSPLFSYSSFFFVAILLSPFTLPFSITFILSLPCLILLLLSLHYFLLLHYLPLLLTSDLFSSLLSNYFFSTFHLVYVCFFSPFICKCGARG